MCATKIGFDSLASYLWCPNSLYHPQCDVDVVIMQMLDRAASKDQILRCIEDLKTSEHINEAKYKELVRFVQATTGDLVDEGPVLAMPNQIPVLLSTEAPQNMLDRSLLSDRLAELTLKMQKLWDFNEKCHRLWSDFVPPRPVPSQYLAFDQLRLRFSSGQPILVSICAPAGYGKSELLSAWLHYTAAQGCKYQVCAVTGVAATQLGGCTLHNLLSLRSDNSTDILQHPDRRQELELLEGIIVDEAMMAEYDLIKSFTEVLCQVPLRKDKRKPGALPKFGYRDIIFGGDLRQLPPASGKMPFWASDAFHEDFEIFVLTEDRRHERDLYTQSIKELVAWGGLDNAAEQDPQTTWPVDSRVREFIIDGYLRGWGLTGEDVDLDVGTALFPRRPDVNRWNASCVRNIEELYTESCEAVDVHGYDPRMIQGAAQPSASTTRTTSLQVMQTLTLRTCPQHRLRVMCLSNHDVKNGWANGTHCRLLQCNSWTGNPKMLTCTGGKKYSAEEVL